MMKLFAVVLIVFFQFPSEDAFKFKPRIVNGHTSPERLFPYYVYLKIDMEEANTFGDCGGTLLNEQFILTAGHCTYEATAIEVHLGTADLYSPHDVVRVEKHNFFQYPYHVVEEIVNDISLIRLPNKVRFTPHIQSVRLPTTCEMTDNIDVVIMGNGFTKDEGPISSQLQYAVLKTIPFETCRITYPFLLSRKLVICALDQENTGRSMSATCFGDSGSPLVKLDGTLMGVTSFHSPEGCDSGHPHGFTRVSSYTKWINNVTGLNLPEW